ncbi:MAG: hypothetical protein IPL42_04925 [Saprospiraceae bacterium]|nr:hypothetical protein [Saprospiraceae bacterium]
MSFKVRIFVVMLSFSLLASQFGFNIYLAYCCCSKILSYSLIPKADPCLMQLKKPACCSKAGCSASVNIKKLPCGNKVIDYKSLQTKAEKPGFFEFPVFDIQSPETYIHWTLSNLKSSLSKIEFHYPDYYESGIFLRKKYCSWIC